MIDIINSGFDAETCEMLILEVKGMEGADCAAMAGDIHDQAVVVLDKEVGAVMVVQINKDRSYWRKITQNKMVRKKEVQRVKAAKLWAADLLEMEDEQYASVVSRGDLT